MKFWGNTQGSTLTGALIASVVVAAMSLVLAQLLDNTGRAGRSLQQSSEYQNLMTTLNSSLADPGSCAASFQPARLNPRTDIEFCYGNSGLDFTPMLDGFDSDQLTQWRTSGTVSSFTGHSVFNPNNRRYGELFIKDVCLKWLRTSGTSGVAASLESKGDAIMTIKLSRRNPNDAQKNFGADMQPIEFRLNMNVQKTATQIRLPGGEANERIDGHRVLSCIRTDTVGSRNVAFITNEYGGTTVGGTDFAQFCRALRGGRIIVKRPIREGLTFTTVEQAMLDADTPETDANRVVWGTIYTKIGVQGLDCDTCTSTGGDYDVNTRTCDESRKVCTVVGGTFDSTARTCTLPRPEESENCRAIAAERFFVDATIPDRTCQARYGHSCDRASCSDPAFGGRAADVNYQAGTKVTVITTGGSVNAGYHETADGCDVGTGRAMFSGGCRVECERKPARATTCSDALISEQPAVINNTTTVTQVAPGTLGGGCGFSGDGVTGRLSPWGVASVESPYLRGSQINCVCASGYTLKQTRTDQTGAAQGTVMYLSGSCIKD